MITLRNIYLALAALLLFTTVVSAQTAPQPSSQPLSQSLPPSTIAAGRTAPVTWDRVAGNWKTFRGKLRQQWGKLTKNDIAIARGRREMLVGRIQARYGIDKDKADAQVEAWLKAQK